MIIHGIYNLNSSKLANSRIDSKKEIFTSNNYVQTNNIDNNIQKEIKDNDYVKQK